METSISASDPSRILSAQTQYSVAGGEEIEETYDCFLSHDWGRNGENHEVVLAINTELQKRGLKTWFDSDRLTGPVSARLSRAIDASSVIVVFVTKRYMRKVNRSGNDFCKKEFNYALKRKNGLSCFVPVLLEEGMRDTSTWDGTFAFSGINDMIYVDMSSDELIQSNMDDLVIEIVKRKSGSRPTGRRLSRLSTPRKHTVELDLDGQTQREKHGRESAPRRGLRPKPMRLLRRITPVGVREEKEGEEEPALVITQADHAEGSWRHWYGSNMPRARAVERVSSFFCIVPYAFQQGLPCRL